MRNGTGGEKPEAVLSGIVIRMKTRDNEIFVVIRVTKGAGGLVTIRREFRLGIVVQNSSSLSDVRTRFPFMSEPFLSEIKIVSFNFPPKGWALANGQPMPINQNQALFSLLGTVYGGNGQTTFALPNLQGKVPLHMGGSFNLGQTGGQYEHTVTLNEMPTHNHFVNAADVPATAGAPGGAPYLARSAGANLYAAPGNYRAMNAGAVSSVGGSQAHTNTQPYLVLNFCIALQGIFPSQN